MWTEEEHIQKPQTDGNLGPWSCVEAMLPSVQPHRHAAVSKQIHEVIIQQIYLAGTE